MTEKHTALQEQPVSAPDQPVDFIWDGASASYLIANRQDLNFLHQAKVDLPKDLSAYQAYCRMTGQPSFFLRLAFWLRDKFSALGGVKAIRGFGHNAPANPPTPGDLLDFFTVEGSAPDSLLLTARDRHLSVLLAIRIGGSSTEKSTLLVTTSVLTHNFFGKIYMLPVGLAHDRIVQNSLKKIAVT